MRADGRERSAIASAACAQRGSRQSLAESGGRVGQVRGSPALRAVLVRGRSRPADPLFPGRLPVASDVVIEHLRFFHGAARSAWPGILERFWWGGRGRRTGWSASPARQRRRKGVLPPAGRSGMPARCMNPRTLPAACPVSSSMWLSPTPQPQYRSLTSGDVSATGRGNRSAREPPVGTRGTPRAVRTAAIRRIGVEGGDQLDLVGAGQRDRPARPDRNAEGVGVAQHGVA